MAQVEKGNRSLPLCGTTAAVPGTDVAVTTVNEHHLLGRARLPSTTANDAGGLLQELTAPALGATIFQVTYTIVATRTCALTGMERTAESLKSRYGGVQRAKDSGLSAPI